MPIETTRLKTEKEKRDDEKSFVEHLIEIRTVVSRVMSGDIETGSGASSTVGHRRFDPQNITSRSTVGDDSSASSDNSGNPVKVISDD